MGQSGPHRIIETIIAREFSNFASSSCRFHSMISPQRNMGEFAVTSPIKGLPSVPMIC